MELFNIHPSKYGGLCGRNDYFLAKPELKRTITGIKGDGGIKK